MKIKKNEPEQKYLISYVRYQHSQLGEDSFVGWQNFTTLITFNDKKNAETVLASLKNDRFVKDIRIYEIKEVKSFSDATALTEEICECCGQNKAVEKHVCPYAQDIFNDSKTMCTCCDSCTRECAEDI